MSFWGAAAGQAAGGIFGGISQIFTNKSNQRFAESQTDKAWKRNVDFWNFQNEYNTPQAQMERLRAAGINPLLPFVKGGNATGGTAATMPQAPVAQNTKIAPRFGNLIDIYDLKLKKAGADKITEETNGIRIDNQRKLVTWLIDEGLLDKERAAEVGIKISEAGLQDIELGRQKGSVLYDSKLVPDAFDTGSKSMEETAGFAKEKRLHIIEQKGNRLIDANAENVEAQNLARKALQEWLKNPTGGWQALKTMLLIVLNK